jgi:WD40-like Beta Propeller Repeat
LKTPLLSILIILSLITCTSKSSDPAVFGSPIKVLVKGYSGNIMEPFITRNGAYLLFNNLNASPENTNLHYATRISDEEFQYKGEIDGANTPDLEGTPTMDKDGNLYFVSTRSYLNTLATIYHASFSSGVAFNVELVNGISKNQSGSVNFDVEVDNSGDYLYFVDGEFDNSGNPSTADIVIAKKSGSSFQRLSNSADILKNINTSALEYASSVSVDGLELFFTRVSAPITSSSVPQIFMANRSNTNAAFGTPVRIDALNGFIEGPSISADGKTLYFHRKDNDKFQLYLTRR